LSQTDNYSLILLGKSRDVQNLIEMFSFCPHVGETKREHLGQLPLAGGCGIRGTEMAVANLFELDGKRSMDKKDSDKRDGDKAKALESALAQIERQFGKGSIMKLGDNPIMDVAATSTGSLGLDIALGIGGLPQGRIIEIYGPESSGKTTLTLHVVAEAQKTGGVCAFVDAEHALDPQSASPTPANRRWRLSIRWCGRVRSM
jgi:recA bacterial DNA recombination protein